MSNANKKMTVINHVKNYYLSSRNFRELVLYKLLALRLQIAVDSNGSNPKKKYYFDLPAAEVIDFFRIFSINRKTLGCVFCTNTDPFTQILIILTASLLCMKDDAIAKEAYLLLLAKIWNDTVDKYFPTSIDPRIMDRVIENKLTGKHLFKQYRTPYRVLAEHFMPELLKKYGPEVVADPVNRTLQLLNQAKGRIDQIFEAKWVIDIDTGERRYYAGLVPLYRDMEKEMKKLAA